MAYLPNINRAGQPALTGGKMDDCGLQVIDEDALKEIQKNPENFVEFSGVWRTQSFIDFMIHRVPDAECVNRIPAITSLCKDKKVLHLGCKGHSKAPSVLHTKLEEVCSFVFGIDKESTDTASDFIQADLDKEDWPLLLTEHEFDLIIASEILEHLSNAGLFFDNCRKFGCPIIVTVPNAYCHSRHAIMRKGIEYDNEQHVAIYSYNTLKTLLIRHGFEVEKFYWVDTPMPFFARGIMFVAK